VKVFWANKNKKNSFEASLFSELPLAFECQVDEGASATGSASSSATVISRTEIDIKIRT